MNEPLQQSMKLQTEAAAIGFDWPRDDALRVHLWAKLHEEILELQQARDLAERVEELGDLLFMAVNIARHLQLDPSAALSAANRKFERRFGYIRQHEQELPPIGDPKRLAAMETLWQAAKQIEKNG